MNKAQAMKLFKTLFATESRTRANWKAMLDSLVTEKEMTERQAYKHYYFGTQPTIDNK